MTIRNRLMLSFLAVALLTGLLGGFALYAAFNHAGEFARHEAAAVAHTVASLVNEYADPGNLLDPRKRAELQAHVLELKELHQRDIVIVDLNRRIIADANTAHLGTAFSRDRAGEVAMTLRDGRARTYVETGQKKQIVLPLDNDRRVRIGAMIMDYTPLYKEIYEDILGHANIFLLFYLAVLAFSLLIGYLLSLNISKPLADLQDAALKVASGDLSVSVKTEAKDELGSLADSFNAMTKGLTWSRDRQTRANNELLAEINLRKQADEALRLSEEKFRTLFEDATDAIFILDMDGNFIDVNRTAYERLGYTKEEMLSFHISQVNAPEFNNVLRERMDRIRTEGRVVIESGHRRKDGSVMPVEVNARTMEFGGKTSIISMVRDITERKRIDAVARASEEKYRDLVESVNSIVLRWSGEGRISFINTFGARFFGYAAGELAGKDVLGTIVPESESTGRDLAAMIRDICRYPERYLNNVNENVRRNGRRVWVSWTNKPVVDDEGRLAEILSIGNDITERMHIQDELRRHREELMNLVDERTRELSASNEHLRREIADRERMEQELVKAQKLESLGVLAGGIAHDFNNLLTTILGNVSIALADIDARHPAYQELARAERATLRAQELTQQLLTFSKGGAPVRKTESIAELIRETTTFALHGGRVKCDFNLPGGLWLVDIDAGQISQVIHNLVINADHAMPDGGAVSVGGENVLIPFPNGPSLPPGKYVKISIRDNGMGIPAEHLSKIFDPYFTTKQRGSGLGLATSYSIINKHGGGIFVESEIGVGTTFDVYLPASSETAVPVRKADTRLQTASGKVLIMDDEEDVRETAGSALRRLGYSIALAEDGSRAIELYREARESGAPFDVVIMDLTVPGGMGGRETLWRLREIDPDVRAIVSSGYSNNPIMAEYEEYGFAGMVAKPYRIRDLGLAVYRVLTQNRPDADISESAATS